MLYNLICYWNKYTSVHLGAAAASRMYVDAVGKLGRQAQQGTWGGCADIGKLPTIYFFQSLNLKVQSNEETVITTWFYKKILWMYS